MSDSCENVLWRLFVSWKNACCPNMCQTCLLATQYFLLYFCQSSHNSWPGSFFSYSFMVYARCLSPVQGSFPTRLHEKINFRASDILSKKWWLVCFTETLITISPFRDNTNLQYHLGIVLDLRNDGFEPKILICWVWWRSKMTFCLEIRCWILSRKDALELLKDHQL